MKLNDLDLNKLAVFMEVVRAGGITKAAAQLRLTPSAVSQSVKALETALDVELFDRVGKRLPPSAAGSVLYQSLGRYQDGLLETLRGLGAGREVVRGRI